MTAFLRIAAGIPVAITLAVLAVPRAHAIDAAPLGNPKSNERYSTEPNSQNDKPKKVFLPMSKYGEAIIEGLEAMGVRVGFSKIARMALWLPTGDMTTSSFFVQLLISQSN